MKIKKIFFRRAKCKLHFQSEPFLKSRLVYKQQENAFEAAGRNLIGILKFIEETKYAESPAKVSSEIPVAKFLEIQKQNRFGYILIYWGRNEGEALHLATIHRIQNDKWAFIPGNQFSHRRKSFFHSKEKAFGAAWRYMFKIFFSV